MDKLEKAGFIVRTRQRRGPTKIVLKCQLVTSWKHARSDIRDGKKCQPRHQEVPTATAHIEETRIETRKKQETLASLAPRAKKPSPISGIRKALETILTPDMAKAVIEHRIAIKKRLTVRAGELLAKRYAQALVVCGLTPDQAADFHIERGWTGFEAEWVLNAKRGKCATGPPNGPATVSDLLMQSQGEKNARTIDHRDTQFPGARSAKPGRA
jgi:hypothetical protein